MVRALFSAKFANWSSLSSSQRSVVISCSPLSDCLIVFEGCKLAVGVEALAKIKGKFALGLLLARGKILVLTADIWAGR